MPRHFLRIVVLSGLGALLAAPAAAQGPGAGEPAGATHFRARVELVPLNVTVVDARQRLVSGLTAGEFRVYEDGVPQDVEMFAAGDVPVDVAILLDASASIGNRMPLIQKAAVGFLRALRPGDRATLIGFREAAQVLAPWTDDLALVEAAVREARPRGGTSLFTSLYVAIRGFGTLPGTGGIARRPAVVVLSDGNDTASLISFDDVLEACQRAGITVYTIRLDRRLPGLRPTPPSAKQAAGDYALRRLAAETGARSLAVSADGDLAAAYGAVAQELANQYLLAYAPKPSTAARPFRRVQVAVTRPGVFPRTRTGYFAVESGAVLAQPSS